MAGRSTPETAFSGRVAVVTGAASGIGRALAERFLQAGARVALLDRDAAGVERAARELGRQGEAFGRPLDVTDPGACEAVLAEVAERFGGIDVLAANAGITHRSTFARTGVEVFRRVMEVNFFGALHCTKAALPWLLQSRGQVVVTSSVAGFAPLLGRSGYCASKHALHGCFETLRCELRDEGVHVMLVCPGFTATGIEGNALGADGAPAGTPQSRVGVQSAPAAVADAIVRAAARRRRTLVLSPVGRLTRILTRLAPASYERLMRRSLRQELEPAASETGRPAGA